MSESRTVFIPAFSLNYDDNMLESIGIGGEMFRRDTPLRVENSRLKAENEKLRELCKGMRDVMWACAAERCPHHMDDCFRVDGNGGTEPVHHQGVCWFESCMRELGIEVR